MRSLDDALLAGVRFGIRHRLNRLIADSNRNRFDVEPGGARVVVDLAQTRRLTLQALAERVAFGMMRMKRYEAGASQTYSRSEQRSS
jgi:hypothetical protein